MKWAALLVLLSFCIGTSAQTSSYTVSMSGIAEIKVGMKISELEKLINQPIKLNRLAKKDSYEMDTVTCTYNGLDATVVLQREEVNEKPEVVVWEVRSSNAQLKTRSGIAIGDDKLKVISTYEGYTIYIMPEYEGADYSIKSKTRSTIWLHGDESGKVIIFYLTNNKITSMSVTYDEGC